MTSPSIPGPTPIGELAAELFVQRLRAQGFRSSNRHIVDYLPTEVAETLFDALLELAEREISIPLPTDEGEDGSVNLLAIPQDHYDIVPFFVNGATSVGGRPNRGTEGFASTLRDHYAVGAQRPRLLVVMTLTGNETQKSAQDVLADQALVTLDLLLESVLNRAAVPSDAPLREVARVYRAHQPEGKHWRRAVEEFEAFVYRVGQLPPEIQGANLPRLGCFLPDPRADYASGESVRVLEDKERRRRCRGEGRLFDNAMMHDFLAEAFTDPIVDPENVLSGVFEDHLDKAREIADGGLAGLATLELGTFAGMEQRRKKGQKNGLNRGSLVIDGGFGKAFGKGSETVIVVSAPGPFSLTFKLRRAFNTKKERAKVITWNAAADKLQLQEVNIENGAESVAFPLAPNAQDGFSVCRVALTRGPRAIRNPIDDILVVVYTSSAEEVVLEEGRLASFEDQAWIAEGKRNFHKYDSNGSSPVAISGVESLPVQKDDEPTTVYRVTLKGSDLVPRVVDERPTPPDGVSADGHFAIEPLLELACTTTRRGHLTTHAMRRNNHYLDAVTEINEGVGRYKVDLEGGDTREVWAMREGAVEPFRYGHAIARLLENPEAIRLTLSPDGWQTHSVNEEVSGSVRAFLAARKDVVASLRELAREKLPRYRRHPEDAAVPLHLLNLERSKALIGDLLSSWCAAADEALTDSPTYGSIHELLLQTDTVRIVDAEGNVERLVVLPTSPWLMSALLDFQTRFAENVRTAVERKGNVQSGWKFELTRDEVLQMVPQSALEHWYVWGTRNGALEATDTAPFHFEFVPVRRRASRAPLDYMSRVVATKIGRYLRMHPHLRNERRKLRIGFVNAGSGRHLLDGLEQWLRNTMEEHAGRIRELPMESIPAIDLFLFSTNGDAGHTGLEFERFFRERVTASDDNVVRQTLLARLQYRYCKGPGPSTKRDAVHICFLHGLVDDTDRKGKTGQLSEWWDGGFGNGLLATYLRRALPGGGAGGLNSRRGLWLDSTASGIRGALARTLALQRGCRDGDVAINKALFWESALPDIASMSPIYEHSEWVVHLDRELSLEIFQRGKRDELPTIIEYSDQEVPQSPGYDTITATKHAKPYLEQLGEILTTADMDVSGRSEEARRAANSILDDINVLSGSWALDFLLGSIADQRTSTRLKGNVGAALVYRWLRRNELGSGTGTVNTNVGPVVPVFISLEDLLRATPAAGLSSKQGLVYRYTNEVEDEDNKEAARWCDDLLLLYLTRTDSRASSRIFGRVIEVKFGKTATSVREKAIGQVRNTKQLLQERLSGNDARLDAPFRHKQLSLLIKTQLEQAVAMGVLDSQIYDFLNVPALSSNLATGNYDVDYTISDRGQHLSGDAFLLHTASEDIHQIDVQVVEGVRIITIPRRLVEWLAFELDDSATLTELPKTTLPRLGKYENVTTLAGDSVRQVPEPKPEQEPAPAVEAEPVPVPVEASQISPEPIPDGSGRDESPAMAEHEGPALSLDEASKLPIKEAPYSGEAVVDAVERLDRALVGHKVRLSSSPSARETDRGPRLIRAYVRLEAGESINAIRRMSEDIARVVGTATSDIHISNVPERHAVGLDLPLPGLTYSVTFDEVMAHPSFDAAQRELKLGFCAGIDLTGLPVWADLAKMPHMLVAGTTGSGKTVFLRNVILTLLLHNNPSELVLRLSSSKPMDFRAFTSAPHAQGHDMAREPIEALDLARALITEMERRYELIDEATCDNLAEFNDENPDRAEPYVVAVFDEYAEMVASFSEKQDRDAFEGAVGRLAQKARAAGIHLVVCMQRPDANALKGAIKANILHRFALKLPQRHDSGIILDEGGAETLLGQGDLLYKDANSRLQRLQVPFLENRTLKQCLKRIDDSGRSAVAGSKTCPQCGRSGPIDEMFGFRNMKRTRKDGTEVVEERAQSYCRACRAVGKG